MPSAPFAPSGSSAPDDQRAPQSGPSHTRPQALLPEAPFPPVITPPLDSWVDPAESDQGAAADALEDEPPIWQQPSLAPDTWLLAPSLSDRLHGWLSVKLPFSWRERAHESNFWRRRGGPLMGMVAMLALALLIGGFALTAIGNAAHRLPANIRTNVNVPGSSNIATDTPGANGVVIGVPPNYTNGTPTPTLPVYEIGAWTANELPTGGAQQTLYARVTHNIGVSNTPAAGVSVLFKVVYPGGAVSTYGPVKTSAYGIAQINITYTTVSGQPIFVTAIATISKGHTISAQTTFVAF